MTRYMRVKNKTTGHEFDLPVEQFDEKKFDRVDRYPETTRPRRPKPKVSKGGPATGEASPKATKSAPASTRRRAPKAAAGGPTTTRPVDNKKED